MENLQKCIITDADAISFMRYTGEVEYSINYFDKSYALRFCSSCFKKKELKDNSHIIRSIILNGGLLEITKKIIHWECDKKYSIDLDIDLKEELSQISYPKTPKEKHDNLINNLYKLQTYDGEIINIQDTEKLWSSCYFKNKEELFLYIATIKENGYISISHDKVNIKSFNFKYKGINYLVNLSDESITSKKCFVAMAFHEKTKNIRKAIIQAIEDTKFKPIIIDDLHISSDYTINDAIISNIRGCKFCIADFTMHRNGVYFESGFALGLGKPVIYLCRKDDFDNAHFDIKPLQHIIYETDEELTRKLTDKIKAWII